MELPLITGGAYGPMCVQDLDGRREGLGERAVPPSHRGHGAFRRKVGSLDEWTWHPPIPVRTVIITVRCHPLP
jgi:hypothetical protein